MNKKAILVLAIMLIAVCGRPSGAFAQEKEAPHSYIIEEAYKYPLQPGSEEWKRAPVETLYECSAVPSYLAENMTTEALLQTVLDYPFIVNLYAGDTPLQGINMLRTRFAPLDLLLGREDALSEILKYREAYENGGKEAGEIKYFIAEHLEKYIRAAELRYEIDPITGGRVAYVYTPKGSAVRVIYGLTYASHGITAEDAAAATREFAAVYNATIVSSADPEYNCHSYAWYSTSASNPHWMNSPDKYMTDGSYSEVFSPASGDRVTYKNGNSLDHSGIITGTGTPKQVTSKWGCAGVLRHTLTNNVYYLWNGSTNIQYWRAN